MDLMVVLGTLCRCLQKVHEERNVLDYLPEAEHDWVRRKLRAAWALEDAEQALSDLNALARELARKRPGAAGSLREGLEETLTVTRLGVTGPLLRTVYTTNPVEPMIKIVRDHAHNVKRWLDGTTALRWAAAGIQAARDQFRRVKASASTRARRQARSRHQQPARRSRPGCHRVTA